MKTSSSSNWAPMCAFVFAVITVLLLAGTASAAPTGGESPLPSLPDGLNVAIGAHVVANSSAAPSTGLSNVDDGDGTSRWCPSTVGIHQVTIDLGRVVNVSGTGVTFSGEEGNDGSYYSVTTGVTAPAQTPFPNQTAGDQNTIVQGPLYLFAGSPSDSGTTVRARYVTLTYRVPREQDICVQELRVFSADAVRDPNLQLGADVSDLRSDTAALSIDGQSASPLSILRDGGVNDVRLRLLVNPTACASSCPDLANDLAIATEARRAGMQIVLELEYSDSETSSSAQPMPAAWVGQSLPHLAQTVRRYTKSVIQAFAANRTPVSQVAIGNEITQGFLWPAGKLTINVSGQASWTGLETLLRAAIAGARTSSGPGVRPRIEIDTDTGGDSTTALDFFDHLQAAGVRFDVIGQTYSPWLQGPLSALKANLISLVRRFGKPLVLAASQFPYADVTGYGDYTAAVPYPDTLPGYLISPAGQASYERDLVSLMASLPHRLGLGVFYLDPDTTGPLGLFTPTGAAQPAVDADRVGSGAVLYGPDTPVATGPGVAGTLPSAPTPSPSPAATLPALPAGLNVALGATASANAGAAPGTALSNIDDGDGTSRYCPSASGIHRITIDLGHAVDVTGTGVTFSGQQGGDGSSYTISTGLDAPAQSPFPNQAADGQNTIATGANYLFAGSDPSSSAIVPARYVTLTYQVPREENICVQELRVFSADAPQASQLERGADLSTLLSDTGPLTLNGSPMPILNIFRSGGLNYVRLRLWINPISGNFGTPTEQPYCAAAVCPDLTNDLTMAKQAQAAGMKLLLDIHYSDTWADPQHQNVPASFDGETLPQLANSVQGYTKSVIQAFAAQGTPVSQVAIGNEITQGMLWQYTTLAAVPTTVTPAGTKTIKVVSTSGISPGDTLFIDSLATSNSIAGVTDPSTEVVKVASVGTSGADGTVITLTQPLQESHTGAVTVQDVQDSGHLLFDPTTDQADWNSLTTLIKAGIAGAQAGNPTGNPLLVQLHIDRGGDNAAATDFVEHMVAAGVHFDVIGLSYYPWYHGPMSAMKANVTALIDRFHKDVLIAEDQYPQEPQLGYGLYDAADANYPDTQAGYLVSPAGQASYQRDLLSLMSSMPNGRGLGVFYWDADAEGYLGQFTTAGAAQPVTDADQVQGAGSTTSQGAQR